MSREQRSKRRRQPTRLKARRSLKEKVEGYATGVFGQRDESGGNDGTSGKIHICSRAEGGEGAKGGTGLGGDEDNAGDGYGTLHRDLEVDQDFHYN